MSANFMKKAIPVEFIYQVFSLLVAVILVHALYVAMIRPNAEAFLQAGQHRLDRTIALIGQRQLVILAIAEFLVLGADPPGLARLLARGDIGGKLIAAFDRATALLGYRHRTDLSRIAGRSQVATADRQVNPP